MTSYILTRLASSPRQPDPVVLIAAIGQHWPTGELLVAPPAQPPQSYVLAWWLSFPPTGKGYADPTLEGILEHDRCTITLAGNFALCAEFVLWYRQQFSADQPLLFFDETRTYQINLTAATSVHDIYRTFDPQLPPLARQFLHMLYDQNGHGIYEELLERLRVLNRDCTVEDVDATVYQLWRDHYIASPSSRWDWQRPISGAPAQIDGIFVDARRRRILLVLTGLGERAVIAHAEV